MTRGVPTEEQLRRIRGGVLDRLDRRRTVARRAAGGAAAVVLIGGGIGLIAGTVSFSSGSATSGASGGSGGAGSSVAQVVVRCHASVAADSPVELAKADPAGLPASAAEACARLVPARSSSSTAAPAPAPSAGPAAVCRAEDGRVHVYPGAEGACARVHMRAIAP